MKLNFTTTTQKNNNVQENDFTDSELFQEIYVEDEDIGRTDEPFNPNLIDIDTKAPTISNIVDQIKNDEIDLAPAFQRKANLWDTKKQSQLIESILLRIPLPAFYFDVEIRDEKKIDTIWHVIDGLQRLCSIKNFMVSEGGGKSLKLNDLEFLKSLEGLTYNDLPRQYQRIINQTQLTVILVKSGTPENVKFNIFKRVNTGGIPLTQQEIRHALNQGIAADFLEELAGMDVFKRATYHKIPERRMLDREFVNRFLAFYVNELSDYTSDMDVFLHNALKRVKTFGPEKRKQIKNEFSDALKLSIQIFDRWGFCKLDKYPFRRPINKAIFEVITVLFAKLSSAQKKQLLSKKQDFMNKYIDLFKNDSTFVGAITGGTGEKGRVKTRFETIEKLLNEVLVCY